MIEHTTVSGKPATVAYIKADFTPCSQKESELIRVHWDDGNTAFLVAEKKEYNSILKSNPCHEPAGSPKGGQFCSVGFEQNILNSLGERYPHLKKVKVEISDFIASLDNVLATKSRTKLLLNSKMWNSDAFWESRKKEWDGLISDPSKEGTVLHEIGHILDGQVLDKLGSDKYQELLEKHIPKGELWNYFTTPYGQEHISEMIAEAFVIREKQIKLPNTREEFQNSILKKSNELWADLDKALSQ
jgi:hypothetical protein